MDQNDVLRLKTLVQEMKAIVDKYDQPTEPGPIEPPAKAITHVILESLNDKPQEYVPFTFGQVFTVGDFKPDSGLAGRFDNGDTIPLQVDVKALHADGSVRHAIISGIGGALFGKEQRKMELIPAKVAAQLAVTPSSFPNGSVKLKIDGVEYSTKDALLHNVKQWLMGSEVGELQARVTLTDSKAKEHPHLTVRAGYRVYRSKHVRLEIVVENDWAYEPNPQNFTYDVAIEIDGKKVYEQKALTHFHHARWRKVFWIGEEPKLNVRLDPAYLIATKALRNYDLAAKPSEKTLQALADEWKGKKIEPMGVGLALPGMPTTGGRRDIGILPGWAVMHLLSQDPRAAMVSNGTADLSGSWAMHYRDKSTDRPVSILDYPYMTMLGNASAKNKITKKDERFPTVPDESKKAVTNTFELSHHPSLTYLSYLQTGDYYYLEELQFTAMYCVFSSNPEYRQAEKGLVAKMQVRGQAWCMRTLLEAAYITPDDDPLKQQFIGFVNNNLDYYNERFANNKDANDYGVLDMGEAFAYKSGTAIAPWQDDFFTSVMGMAVDMGFEKARPMLQWKAKFPIGRLTGQDVDWRSAANYTYSIKENSTLPVLKSITAAYKATVEAMKTGTGEEKETFRVINSAQQTISGYPDSPIGYGANMQPAVAAAADYAGEAGRKAWERFNSRDIKPDYTTAPQFAIYPRAK